MNLQAVIENHEYRLLETASSLDGQELFVICEDIGGRKFVCPQDFWLSYAPEPEVTAPVHSGSTSQEKIAFFLSLFQGRKTCMRNVTII